MSRLRYLAVVPLALLPVAALAQSVPADDRPIPVEGLLAPPAPGGSNDAIFRGFDLNLDISEDESKASFSIGGYRVDDTELGGGDASQQSYSWSAKLALPVGGGDDITSKKTRNGFYDGAKLTLGASLLSFGSSPRRAFNPPFDSLPRTLGATDTIMGRAIAACRNQAADAAAIKACENAGPSPDFAVKYGASRREVAKALYSGMTRFGFDGSIGVDRFAFIIPVTLAERKVTKPQFSGGAYIAYYPADAATAFIGRVEYANLFKASDEAIICKPVVVTPADDCVKGSPARPANVEKLNLSLDARHVFDIGIQPLKIGLGVTGTIDALGGDWKVEVPLYFIPSGKSPVLPGIKATYSSDTNEFDVAIFLRATFGFD